MGAPSPTEAVAEEGAAAQAARCAVACIGHELAGPITALYTHLKLAQRKRDVESVDAALRAVDRLRDIANALRDTAADAPAADVPAFGVLLARAAVGMEISATIHSEPANVPARLAIVLREALRAVARTAAGAALNVDVEARRVRIDGGALPDGAAWRTLSPLADSHLGLDLWLAAYGAQQIGGALRVAEPGGTIAVELELPE